MQTTAMDVVITLEVRVWAKNQKEKDELANDVYKRLRDIQFTASGSVVNNLHDYALISMIEIDEIDIKSRVIQVSYTFWNID